jgi:hypothetical protein
MNSKAECIDLIQRTGQLNNLTDRDIDELLERIRPFIVKKYNEQLYLQIEKLCKVRNFERAVKLMNAVPNRGFLLAGKGRLTSFMVAFIVLLGAGISVFVSQTETTEQSQTTWNSADAEIVTSRVSSRINPSTGSSEDYPLVEYKYTVDGKNFRSDSLYISTSDSPEEIVSQFSEGETVQISYNSNNPQESYLSVTSESIGYFFVLSSIFGVFIFIYLFGKKFRQKNK